MLPIKPSQSLSKKPGRLYPAAVGLDLQAHWWKRWWATRSRQRERVEALAQLIRHNFYPDLLEAARAHLQDGKRGCFANSLSYMGSIEFLQEPEQLR
jgi:hypothetical protein